MPAQKWTRSSMERIESSETAPRLCGQLTYDKGGENGQQGKSLQQMVLGEPDSVMPKNETGPLSYAEHKKKHNS